MQNLLCIEAQEAYNTFYMPSSVTYVPINSLTDVQNFNVKYHHNLCDHPNQQCGLNALLTPIRQWTFELLSPQDHRKRHNNAKINPSDSNTTNSPLFTSEDNFIANNMKITQPSLEAMVIITLRNSPATINIFENLLISKLVPNVFDYNYFSVYLDKVEPFNH